MIRAAYFIQNCEQFQSCSWFSMIHTVAWGCLNVCCFWGGGVKILLIFLPFAELRKDPKLNLLFAHSVFPVLLEEVSYFSVFLLLVFFA